MWRRVLLVLAIWDYTASQPITEDAEDARASQYDFVKCCPCPGSEFWDQFAAGNIQSSDGASSARSSAGECQCRGRDADAMAAPSLLLPQIAQPVLLQVKTQEDKEDSKTFLQPEVNMASGVLETLREATDEEYRDALARDAARSANEADDAAKPLVTIVIDPNPESVDSLSEASHAQESRISPPSEFNLEEARETETVPLNIKPRNKIIDLSDSASKIRERVASLSKGREGVKFKHNPSVQSLLPGKEKPNLLGDARLKKILKLNELGSKLFKNSKDDANGISDVGSTKVFDPKTPILRRLTPTSAKKQAKETQNDVDLNVAPSDVKNQVIEGENKPFFGLKSLIPRKEIGVTKKPLTLSNLLNLKDVELIHSKPLKLSLPTLDLLPISRNRKENKNKNSDKCNKDVKEAMTDVHKIPNTEILDVLPSASESQPVIHNEVVPESDTEVSSIKDVKSSNEETSTEGFEDTTLVPEQNVKSDDSGIEIIITGNEGKEIENITIEREEFNQPEEESPSDEIGTENILPSSDINSVNQPLVNDEDFEVNEEIRNEETNFEKSTDEDGDTNQRQSFVESEEITDEFIESGEENDMIHATSNDAFQFESEETESEDFEFRSGKTIQDQAVDSESTEINPKNIESSTIDLTSAVSSSENKANEEQSEETENLETFATNSQSDESIQDFEKNAEMNKPEKEISKTVMPSIKERISIKFKTLNKPKTNVLAVTRNNKSIEDAGSTSTGENMPEADNKEPKSDLPDDITPKRPKSKDDTNQVAVENNDMSLSASSQEPTFVKAVPDSSETLSREEKLCPCSQIAKDANESQEQDQPMDDSGTGASFQRENIVQPASLFANDNVFNRPLLPPLPSISLRAHIPTLEELNARIPSLLPLNTFEREASNEDFDGDCPDKEPTMSSDASTASFKSSFTPLRPLDDINLDIYQIKPSGSVGSAKIPNLNLNSFKSKLALPKNLGLKPIELQSSLGNKKNGLLGATLRFGPARIGSRNRGPAILESRLKSLPSLDEIRDTMQSSASNLLSSSITLPKTGLLGNSLPTVDTISQHLESHRDNIRAHTEDTVKNIQDTLASTFSEARVNSIAKPRKFTKPQQQNLLEMVSSAHEDVNDKLRAIHLDFQDRLSSLHDEIIENAKLPKLKLHSAKSTSKLSDMLPLTKTLGSQKHSPSKSKSSLHLSSNKKSQRKPSLKVNIPSQFDTKLSSSQPENNFENSKSIRPFKISKAAPSLQTNNVNVPKLITTSPNSLFARLPKADGFELREKEPLSRSKPLIKPFRTLGDVKITIETTPRPTTAKLTEKSPKLGVAHMFRERESSTPKTTRPTLAQRIQATKDSKGFASEVHPARVPAPTSARKASENTKSPVRSSQVTERPRLRTTKKTTIAPVTLTKSAAPKGSASKKEPSLRSKLLTPKTVSTPKLTTPKPTESPVLAKLREALKARVANKSEAPKKLVSPVRKADQDMLRSASKDNPITVVHKDAMKENVTYKCKMMCVKD